MGSESVIHHLPIVNRRSKPRQVEHPIYVGRRYSLAEGLADGQAGHLCADPDLCIGGYRTAPDRAQIIAADPVRQPGRLFVWNPDADHRSLHGVLAVPSDAGASRLAVNRLGLAATQLVGPDLDILGEDAKLRLTAAFDLQWHADVCDAELGAVHLVQSSRSIRFEDDSEQVLIDTGECEGAVRYAGSDTADARAVWPIGERCVAGASVAVPYQLELTQWIPSEVNGKAVADVTVLEKYTSYFLQCEDPADQENRIWVPLLSPVMWGWSIRVGRRTDGEWGILRRKLFMPTSTDEGLFLPVWQSSTRLLRHNLELPT